MLLLLGFRIKGRIIKVWTLLSSKGIKELYKILKFAGTNLRLIRVRLPTVHVGELFEPEKLDVKEELVWSNELNEGVFF